MIDLIERARKMFELPPVAYEFFNTGLEMEATKRHVKEQAEKYGVEIKTIRPKIGIVQATREHGIPFKSKLFSQCIEVLQTKNVPLEIVDEYEAAEDKAAIFTELCERYPNAKMGISFLCSCGKNGEPRQTQTTINSASYFLDFMRENPMPFRCSSKCCNYCKKKPAHEAQKDYDLIITGERAAEGGIRSMPSLTQQRSGAGVSCFYETGDGKHRLRPLYFVTDRDKAWYKEYYKIKYSDAYEVYGLTRTGCCGCSISAKAAEDLEKIRPYEPNLVKAAWAVFGPSYEYRAKFVEYRKRRQAEAKEAEREK